MSKCKLFLIGLFGSRDLKPWKAGFPLFSGSGPLQLSRRLDTSETERRKGRHFPVDLWIPIVGCKSGVGDADRWECWHFPIDAWFPEVRCKTCDRREIVVSHIQLLNTKTLAVFEFPA